jgi:hypothetical protein
MCDFDPQLLIGPLAVHMYPKRKFRCETWQLIGTAIVLHDILIKEIIAAYLTTDVYTVHLIR